MGEEEASQPRAPRAGPRRSGEHWSPRPQRRPTVPQAAFEKPDGFAEGPGKWTTQHIAAQWLRLEADVAARPRLRPSGEPSSQRRPRRPSKPRRREDWIHSCNGDSASGCAACVVRGSAGRGHTRQSEGRELARELSPATLLVVSRTPRRYFL